MEPLNDRELSEVMKQLPSSLVPATLETRIFGPRTKRRSRWLKFGISDSVRIPIPILTFIVFVFVSLAWLLFREGRSQRVPVAARPDVSLETVREKEPSPASQTSGNRETSAVRLNDHTLAVPPRAADQNLITSSDPVYPAGKQNLGSRGTVRLLIRIGTDGHVVDASVVKGDPVLVPAAVAAVKERVYRPTLLNGNPIAVVSEVEVTFKLSVTLITSLVQ